MQHGVARAGMFFMTEELLGFQPRGIDALFGARAFSWSLASLTDIALKPTLRKLRVTLLPRTGATGSSCRTLSLSFTTCSHGVPARAAVYGPYRASPDERGCTIVIVIVVVLVVAAFVLVVVDARYGSRRGSKGAAGSPGTPPPGRPRRARRNNPR